MPRLAFPNQLAAGACHVLASAASDTDRNGRIGQQAAEGPDAGFFGSFESGTLMGIEGT